MSYNKITLHENASYGYLVVSRAELTNEEINTINALSEPIKWNSLGSDIFDILVNFERNLDSSYIEGVTEPITSWEIYRKETSKDALTLVAKVDNKTTSLIDPVPGVNKTYKYYVFPETENMIGLSMISNAVQPCLNGKYSMTALRQLEDGSYIADDTWFFALNLTSSQISQNLSLTPMETLSKYEKMQKGKKNFLSMGVTCLLGGIDDATNQYDSDIDKLNSFRDFLAQSDMFLWKDKLGDVRIVSLSGTPTTKYLDETFEQAQEVSFEVQEIIDILDVNKGVIMGV